MQFVTICDDVTILKKNRHEVKLLFISKLHHYCDEMTIIFRNIYQVCARVCMCVCARVKSFSIFFRHFVTTLCKLLKISHLTRDNLCDNNFFVTIFSSQLHTFTTFVHIFHLPCNPLLELLTLFRQQLTHF
jgi:hypothetical protein